MIRMLRRVLPLCVLLSACDTREPTRPEYAPPLANLYSGGGVSCNAQYLAWEQGIHLWTGTKAGTVWPTNTGDCNTMQTGVPHTFDFSYTFASGSLGGFKGDTEDEAKMQWRYLTLILNNGLVSNVELNSALRYDSDTVHVVYTFTPDETVERAFISIGHNSLSPELDSTGGMEDREIVMHVWRQPDPPTLRAVGDTLYMDFPWHYYVRTLESSCAPTDTVAVASAGSHSFGVRDRSCTYVAKAYFSIGGPWPHISVNQGVSLENSFWVGSAPFKFPAVTEPLTITTTSLPNATMGVPYSYQLTAAGGQGTRSWSTSGQLPNGIYLGPSGELSGTPTDTQMRQFTVSVQDETGTASKSLTLVIDPPALSVAIDGPSALRPAEACTYRAEQLTVNGQPANPDDFDFAWYSRINAGSESLVGTEQTYKLFAPNSGSVELRVAATLRGTSAYTSATKSVSVDESAARCLEPSGIDG